MRISLALVLAAATSVAQAADVTTITTCPSQPPQPVKFTVDCTHVKDAATRQMCAAFIANQACKVFSAYREITGIKLEQRCPAINYTIYDQDNFPHAGAGGLSYNCQIDHMAQFAIQQFANSPVGPYEDHEILHHFQMTSKELAAMTATHPLFESSMIEVEGELGDHASHDLALTRLKAEIPQLRASLDGGKIKPADQCKVARAVVEGELYLENSRNVRLFYSKLESLAPKSAAEREAGFNAMLNDLAGGKAKAFLTTHGCAPF